MNPSSLFDLSGKTALVTGGGNGIGKASCELLAASGAGVVVSDFKLDDAEAVAEGIRASGGSAVANDCDVTDDAQRVRAVEAAVKEFGGLHVLVNNVGGGGAGKEDPAELELEQFERVFRMNVFATWRMCQLAAPRMKEGGYGSIVNMSSMASVNTSPAISAYASSKAAINHMSRNLAFDFGKDGTRVNAIGPGAVRTHALATVLTPEIEESMLEHTPIKRLGEVEDIAGAVLYFAAPVSRWVSGQVLFVNGGGTQTLD